MTKCKSVGLYIYLTYWNRLGGKASRVPSEHVTLEFI